MLSKHEGNPEVLYPVSEQRLHCQALSAPRSISEARRHLHLDLCEKMRCRAVIVMRTTTPKAPHFSMSAAHQMSKVGRITSFRASETKVGFSLLVVRKAPSQKQ